MRKLRFFLDFDGTVASSDVVDLVLERFAPEAWRAIEREWSEGKIGSRECLSRQVGLVQAEPAALDALLAGVGVDPGFEPFLAAAAELGVPVGIVSDGFDLFIRAILERALADRGRLAALPVCSNRLEREGGRLRASFPAAPCAHGCANCKPAAMRRAKADGDYVVFVGDGLSDRFAAHEADLVFAKNKLLAYCAAQGVRHRVYTGFDEIERWLRECAAGQRAYKTLHNL